MGNSKSIDVAEEDEEEVKRYREGSASSDCFISTPGGGFEAGFSASTMTRVQVLMERPFGLELTFRTILVIVYSMTGGLSMTIAIVIYIISSIFQSA